MVTLTQIKHVEKIVKQAARHGKRYTKWGDGTMKFVDVSLSLYDTADLEAALHELKQLRVLRNQVLMAEHGDLPADYMEALIALAHATKAPKVKPGPKPRRGLNGPPTRRGGPPAATILPAPCPIYREGQRGLEGTVEERRRG